MVALAILGIGIVSLLGAHRMALAHQQKALTRDFALQLAEEKLNEARSIKEGISLNGEVAFQKHVFYWTRHKRPIQVGLSEWDVTVQWGDVRSDEVRLITWIQEPFGGKEQP